MEVKRDVKSLRTVSSAYAGRSGLLTAVLQYFYQAIALADTDEALSREFERLGGEKLRQLFRLGSLIAKLGASPVFTTLPPFPVSYFSASCVEYGKTPASMLAADFAMESNLTEKFCTISEELEDPAALAVIKDISEETKGHLAAVRRQMKRLQTSPA